MKMLIVEDHPFVALSTKTLFLSMGVEEVMVCKDAHEAMDMFGRKDWFRIWLDINVPGARGLSLIRHVAEIGLAPRSAVITATDNQHWRLDVQSLGFLGYILKTASVDEFNHALSEIIKGKSYHSTPNSQNKPIYLTTRQIQILQLLSEGLCTKRISKAINISCGTIDNHISNILSALDVDDRMQAVLIGMKLGYIEQSFK
jgi:DNA-binding NarL/FixJ family response regulator